jgi:hypothetical protein
MRMDIIQKLLCVTPPSSGTFKHQKIEYRELTSWKGNFPIKLPLSHAFDHIGVDLDLTIRFEVLLSPEMDPHGAN